MIPAVHQTWRSQAALLHDAAHLAVYQRLITEEYLPESRYAYNFWDDDDIGDLYDR